MRRWLWMLMTWPLLAWGEERFPPPEFSDTYQMPLTTAPLPRAEWLAYIDIVVLLVALLLAAYLVHVRRSRAGIFALMLTSLAYFGFYRHGCVCPVGSIQNVAQAVANPHLALPLTVAAFFLLPLVVALFFGRAFCAGVCPLGAAQDVVLLRPLKVPAWLEHALGLLAYLYLGVAVLFAATGALYLICQYDPFVAFFRRSGSTTMLVAGAVMLGLSTVVGRPYCRFLCPYSVLLRWLAPLAWKRVSITPTTCVQCRLCEGSCPFGAIRTPSPAAIPGGMREGKARLGLLLLLLPVLLAVGGGLGYFGSGALAGYHPTIRTANRVWLEENGKAQGMTLESTAFRQRGETRKQLFTQAAGVRRQFTLGGVLLGLWTSLVVGLKLISLSLRRRRTDYEADPAACLACGRCYRFCPQELERRGITPPSETAGAP